jgi:hypothetical protein
VWGHGRTRTLTLDRPFRDLRELSEVIQHIVKNAVDMLTTQRIQGPSTLSFGPHDTRGAEQPQVVAH